MPKAKTITDLDLVTLHSLATGASVASGRFDRLLDLELMTFESRISLRGTSLQRIERAEITPAGQKRLAAYKKSLEDA